MSFQIFQAWVFQVSLSLLLLAVAGGVSVRVRTIKGYVVVVRRYRYEGSWSAGEALQPLIKLGLLKILLLKLSRRCSPQCLMSLPLLMLLLLMVLTKPLLLLLRLLMVLLLVLRLLVKLLIMLLIVMLLLLLLQRLYF